MADSTDQDWKKWGKTDPYFAVCSSEQFRLNNLNSDSRDQFFAGGSEHIEHVFKMVRSFIPSFAPSSAVDFGCGTGRLLIPLAQKCTAKVVGVDISEEMLSETRRNCEAHGIRHAQLLLSDDSLSLLQDHYDFIHSFIVLQHIPVLRGEEIFRALLNRLNAKGVFALHFTVGTEASLFRRSIYWMRKTVPFMHPLISFLRGQPFGAPLMQMNIYSLDRLKKIALGQNISNLSISSIRNGGYTSVYLVGQLDAK